MPHVKCANVCAHTQKRTNTHSLTHSNPIIQLRFIIFFSPSSCCSHWKSISKIIHLKEHKTYTQSILFIRQMDFVVLLLQLPLTTLCCNMISNCAHTFLHINIYWEEEEEKKIEEKKCCVRKLVALFTLPFYYCYYYQRANIQMIITIMKTKWNYTCNFRLELVMFICHLFYNGISFCPPFRSCNVFGCILRRTLHAVRANENICNTFTHTLQ